MSKMSIGYEYKSKEVWKLREQILESTTIEDISNFVEKLPITPETESDTDFLKNDDFDIMRHVSKVNESYIRNGRVSTLSHHLFLHYVDDKPLESAYIIELSCMIENYNKLEDKYSEYFDFSDNIISKNNLQKMVDNISDYTTKEYVKRPSRRRSND